MLTAATGPDRRGRAPRRALSRAAPLVVACALAGCGQGVGGHRSSATTTPASTAATPTAATPTAATSAAATSAAATSAAPTTSAPTTAATATSAPTTAPAAAAAPLGTTRLVRAGSSRLQVTIGPVLDPLTGSSASLPRRTRAVGVVVTIRNAAGATYDSTASGDVALSTSAGPAPPLFVRRGRCETPLTDFESLIGAGQSRSGCVAFSVGRGARLLGVRFSPHSRAPGSVAWR